MMRRWMFFFTLIVVAITLFYFLNSNIFDKVPNKDGGVQAKDVAVLVGLFISLWSFIQVFIRSIAPGASKSAQSFLDIIGNPLDVVSRHFNEQIISCKKPVLICIDDLDRCQPDYVVGLLEGIQSLFRGTGVIYLVACDREYISVCFEKKYDFLKNSPGETGNRVGYFFLDKLFQISTRLPVLQPTARKFYTDSLLGVKNERQSVMIGGKELDLSGAYNDDSALESLKKIEGEYKNDPIEITRLRHEVAIKMYDDVESDINQHRLQKFVDFLGVNPRAIKRFLNTYQFYRVISVLEGTFVERTYLARWLIIQQRWPLLADHLEQSPKRVEELLPTYKSKNNSIKDDDIIAKFHDHEEVQSLIQGKDNKPITAEHIMACIGKA